MSAERATLLMVKGVVSEASADDQERIADLANTLRAIVKTNGAPALLALSLVTLELAIAGELVGSRNGH